MNPAHSSATAFTHHYCIHSLQMFTQHARGGKRLQRVIRRLLLLAIRSLCRGFCLPYSPHRLKDVHERVLGPRHHRGHGDVDFGVVVLLRLVARRQIIRETAQGLQLHEDGGSAARNRRMMQRGVLR